MSKQSGKLFGVPINDGVNKQLERRKALLSKTERTPEELMLLSNRGAWVRLVSGINVVPKENQARYKYLSVPNIANEDRDEIISELKKVGNEDAKENILIGGTLYSKTKTQERDGKKINVTTPFLRDGLQVNQVGLNDNSGTYSQSPTYGYRPMPGIVSFKVASKSAYGALKEAEVGIQVNSREQLDIIDKLYLRPGYDMLIEWGNASYIDKSGEPVIHSNSVFGDFLTAKPPRDINAKIQQIKDKSEYNYDALIGKVINFTWNYNQDGTYLCSIKLITRGELIESLNSNKHATKDNSLQKYSKENTGPGSSDIDTSDTISLLINSLRYINVETFNNFKNELEDGDKITVVRTPELKGETHSDDSDTEGSKNYHWFIPLRDLFSILNQRFIERSSLEDTVFKFSTDFNQGTYVTHKLHVSSDPGICALPYKGNPQSKQLAGRTVRDMYGNIVPTTFQQAYNSMNSKFEEGEFSIKSPLSILVNLDHVLDVQKTFLNQKKSNLNKQQVLYSFIKQILDDISTSLGGINIFDLHSDDENDQWVLVDRNAFGSSPESEPLPRIDITGLNSFVTNFGLSSKISNAIATQLAIGASASGLSQRGNETLLKYNEDLINRYDFAPPLGTTLTVTNEEDELLDLMDQIGNAYISYFAGRTYSKSEFKDLVIKNSTFSEVYGAKERRSDRIDKKPTYFPGLLPMDLNLEIDGISGLKVGEAFTINPEILPKRYENKIGFVITQIENQVGNDNRWSTALTCKMFNLPATAVATEIEAKKKEEAKTQPKPPTKTTGVNGWLTPSSHPWSAAFISFVAKKGYSNFPGKTSHTAYAQALRSDSNWTILDARKTNPKVGDIILKGRAGNNINFRDSKYKGSSHSDIVVAVSGRNYTIIGGNVGDTVKKQYKTSTSSGYESPWVIVMRPKTSSVNVQAIVSACESEWRDWHLSQNDKDSQYADREKVANLETARGDTLLKRLDSYWAAASPSWGGQITREA